jgi:hypothetical protein
VQLRDILQATSRTSACCLLHADCFVVEDGGDISLETLTDFSHDYTALHPSRYNSARTRTRRRKNYGSKSEPVGALCVVAQSSYFDPAGSKVTEFLVTHKITYIYQPHGTADKLVKVQSIS